MQLPIYTGSQILHIIIYNLTHKGEPPPYQHSGLLGLALIPIALAFLKCSFSVCNGVHNYKYSCGGVYIVLQLVHNISIYVCIYHTCTHAHQLTASYYYLYIIWFGFHPYEYYDRVVQIHLECFCMRHRNLINSK